MNTFLDEACAILNDFENEIARIRASYKQTAADNLNFDPMLPEGWQETYYRMWLHAVTDVWERNELEHWLIDYPPSTTVANSPAAEVYAAWRKWLPVAGLSKQEAVALAQEWRIHAIVVHCSNGTIYLRPEYHAKRFREMVC